MKKLLLLIFLSANFLALQAQHSLRGLVQSEAGEPLIGVNIQEKGSNRGAVSDFDGRFVFMASSGQSTLVFSYTGYATQEVTLGGQTELTVTMVEGIDLGVVQVVGSRSFRRSATDTPVAIDIIDINEVTNRNGYVEINQILQYAAPSFNATKQSGSDGADHTDPATLRGLGPDQTLVLINGKRRHQSSLVNIFGSRGRGNTGSDLNAIPAMAIKRIEILRDGASAQYGSDAIAGVINIVLQDRVGEFAGAVTYGAYRTQAEGEFADGVANTDGNRLDGEDRSFDGNSVKVQGNYGVGIGEGGFANVTMEYFNKEHILRPGADFRKGFGEAAIESFGLMLNAAVPVGPKSDFYLFGGRNQRATDAFAFTRNNPTARNVVSIYPEGYTPHITSVIADNSLSGGFRTTMPSGWNVDLNHTYGINDFHYFIQGTLNASLQEASPTDFDAGGHNLSQNTSSLNFSRFFAGWLQGANLAFGMEYRTENFEIYAGEEGAYATYDVNGLPIVNPATQEIPIDPITGDPRPGGSQGFPGYSPANTINRARSNFALYADGEFDLTSRLLLSVAGRYEDYSDFGNTLNFKAASRYKFSDAFTLRGSVSSGFRAPSLVQIYYNLRFTDFVAGVAQDVLLSPNNSPVTRAFGIQNLKEETALNTSLGFTLSTGNFTATIDGYLINIKDRIVLTGQFDASSLNLNVVAAQFFANGLDTKTQGLDVVLAWRKYVGQNRLSAALVGNFNQMEITATKNGNLDQATFFGPRDEYFLLASAPPSKVGLNLGFGTPRFDLALAVTRFSEVELLGYEVFEFDDQFSKEAIAAALDVYEARFVADLSVSYALSKNLRWTLGANNLLNAYPTQQDADWTETGGFWDAVQMGAGGAYYFTRLGLNF